MPLLASLALRIRLTTVEHAEAFCRDAAHGLLLDLPGGVPPSAMPGDIELLVDIPHKRTLKLRAHVSRVEPTETGALASIRASGFSMEKAASSLDPSRARMRSSARPIRHVKS